MRQQPFASPEEALAQLQHHGVKGMRWGVRKQDPSGLGSRHLRTVSAPSDKPSEVPKVLSEKKQRKVEKFEQRADVMQTKISDLKVSNEALAGTRNPAKLYKKQLNKNQINALSKEQVRAVRDSEAVKKGKLTSNQKRVLVGVGVAGVLVAGGLVLRGQQSGAFNSAALRGEAFLRGQKTPFATNPKLSGKMSAHDLLHNVAKPVNPGYSKTGGKMNCRRSTYAYELRRRGFDVHATTSAVGWGQSESGVINAVTPGSRNFYRQMSMSTAVVNTGTSSVARGDKRISPLKKIILDNLHADKEAEADSVARILRNLKRGKGPLDGAMESPTVSSSKRVLEEIAKQPNGARGEVLFKFPGFGHSMAYEVVDGVPHIFDSQKGTLYNAATKMVESKWDGFSGAEITRLDNVDLDLNFLTRWANNY